MRIKEDNEIKNIHRGLDMYEWMSDGRGIDYDGDIIKIKAKLINYKEAPSFDYF